MGVVLSFCFGICVGLIAAMVIYVINNGDS